MLDEIETPEDVIKKYDKLVTPLQLRFENYFYQDKEKLDQLRKPENRKLFDDLENELTQQNEEIERDRERADELVKEINEIETASIGEEAFTVRLKEKQAELLTLKLDYGQEILNKALALCTSHDLDFNLAEKTVVLGHILERYSKYTAIDHCLGMCKDAENLVDDSFGNDKLDYAINTETMKEELAKDLKDPKETGGLDFVMSDIINDPVVRYKELQELLMTSLDSDSIEDLKLKLNIGARLHNIGKICVPLSLLNFPKRLSDSQFTTTAQHIKDGERVLTKFGFPDEIKDMALYHHPKKPDYQEILKTIPRVGGSIKNPPQAKLIEIIDIYNAMTTARPYKEAKSRLVALIIVKEEIGDDHEYKELYKLFVKYLCNKS